MDRLLGKIHLVYVDLNVFTGTMQGGKEYQELAQREGEHMIVGNGFEKKSLTNSVGGVREEALYYK